MDHTQKKADVEQEQDRSSLEKKVDMEIAQHTPSDMDVIRSCMDKDKDGNSSCPMSIDLIHFIGKTEQDLEDESLYKVDSTRLIQNAILKIQPRKSIIQIDLIFKTAQDPELRLVWSMLEEYGKDTSMLSDKDGMYHLNFTLMPDKYIGRYILTFLDPIYWALQPEVIGMVNYNVIRTIFPLEGSQITKYEKEEIEMNEIEANVQREITNIRKER